jgi:hypothetical protein
MSTDIIQYQGTNPGKDGEIFSLPALKLFLAISLPMMVLTFLAWGAIYYWARWRAERKSNKQDIEHTGRPEIIRNPQLNISEKTESRSRELTGLSGHTLTQGTAQQSASHWKAWFSRALML